MSEKRSNGRDKRQDCQLTLVDRKVTAIAEDDGVRVLALAIIADRAGRFLRRKVGFGVRDELGLEVTQMGRATISRVEREHRADASSHGPMGCKYSRDRTTPSPIDP